MGTEVLDVSELPLLFAGAPPPPSLSWRHGPDLRFPRYDFSLAGPIGGLLFAVGGSGARRLVEVLATTNIVTWLAAMRDGQLQAAASATVARPARQPPAVQPSLSGVVADMHWALYNVELPDTRSSGNTVAVGRSLYLIGGSQTAVMRYTLGKPSWEVAGAELDSMRLGAKAVVLGCG
eukprot:NODE_747_length_1379_cov_209.781722.p3 GENE.NODE_747_length_1379_cov_209.781722~~NODE_747_length_1379_cov_209.781722.p3  ORF type:complete len:178 (+),score=43.82 NODE_747_length_1379_cov_209.781722:3-536(+)